MKLFFNIKSNKLHILLLQLSFILLTFPRSLKNVSETLYNGVALLKLFIAAVFFFIIIIKKIKLSKFTKIFLFFFIYVFAITCANYHSAEYFLKVYLLNIGILFFCEVVFNSKDNEKLLSWFTKYLFFLLCVNTIDIAFSSFLNIGFYHYYKTYILGMDNRFILYIIPTLIGFYYLYTNNGKSTKYNKYLLYTYLLGLISLFVVWSVAALCVLILIGLGYLILRKHNFKLNPYYLVLFVILASVLIVFFKAQYLFKFLIVDILHKSLDLSYRSDVWDTAIQCLKLNPVNAALGFGFYDLTKAIDLPYALRIGHLHNLLLNLIFYFGIAGAIIYLKGIFSICKNIKKINNIVSKNMVILIFFGLMILMIFDTFELYPIYYYILFVLFKSPDLFNK